MKKLLAALLAGLLAIGCAGCQPQSSGNGGKDDSWDKVKAAGKLVMGMDQAFPPMGFVDTEHSGELVGLDVDMAQEVCDRLGIELVKTPIDWDQKTNELNDDGVDCLWNGLSWTQARADAMNLSVPYMKNNQVILVLQGSSYQKLDDLKGKVLGVQSDSSALDALNAEENKAFKESLGETVELGDYAKAILEIDNKTIDAIAIDEVVARYYLQTQAGKFRILGTDDQPETLTKEDFVVAFRKNDNALKQKVEETLTAMAKDGTLAKISEKWIGKDVMTIGK